MSLTEAQWLACLYPDVLLDCAARRVSARKLRLFAVACCRRIDHLLTDPLCRRAVAVAERFADGRADDRERGEVEAALEVLCQSAPGGAARVPYKAAHHCTHRTAYYAALWSAYWTSKGDCPAPRREQAALLRHIAGNPFRPAPPAPGPAAVVQLAAALYDGADCAFALHDALLEAGRPDLAEHFRAEAVHPKGCHVVDLILGKE